MKDVNGKVAVVTGAASGIGRGMCETFVQAGMRVVLSDVEEKALAQETLRQYGAVHVVCNNAGVGASGYPSGRSTLDDWRWVLGVNLMGVIHGVRTFLPIMIDQGTEGHVVDTPGPSSTSSASGSRSRGGAA
jgi:NAD(P)-dependent dehydrogenase (short-subunit alcohol dehydrogenase family)